VSVPSSVAAVAAVAAPATSDKAEVVVSQTPEKTSEKTSEPIAV
jgi:hypothetical protein